MPNMKKIKKEKNIGKILCSRKIHHGNEKLSFETHLILKNRLPDITENLYFR